MFSCVEDELDGGVVSTVGRLIQLNGTIAEDGTLLKEITL